MQDYRPLHIQVKEIVNDIKYRIITDTDIDRIISLITSYSKEE